MTRDELLVELAALEAHIDNRVDIVRVIIAPDGTVVGKVRRGSFYAAPDYEPPTFEELMKQAKGKQP